MRFYFTIREILDLIVSAIILTLGFWIFWDGSISITEVVIGATSGFLIHEMSHKFVAQQLRYSAHYKIWKMGSFLLVVSAFLKFLFAAPGSVQLGPKIDLYGRESMAKKEIGIISLVGPLSNIILAVVFILGGFYYPMLHNVVFINLFLAGFNMIPFSPFDGQKVKQWSWGVWLATIIAIISLAIASSRFI